MFESSVFEELGIPPKYLKKTPKQERFVALVHKQWLITLYKQFQLIDFLEKPRLEMWDEKNETPSSPWIKTFISVFKKKDFKVIPLPRIRPKSFNDDNPLLFAQLMQYVSQSNFKNLWKQAYQKYRTDSSAEDFKKEDQASLVDYNDVLREIILRLYGCLIVNIFDPRQNLDCSKDFQVHLNVLPSFFGVETLNAIFLFHIPYLEHNLVDCVTFSPAILAKCYSKPLFIIYQLIQLLKSLHDRSLTLGDISLNDIYLTEDLWIYVFPQVSSNIYIQSNNREIPHSMMRDCRKFGHKFDSRNLKCEFCGLRTFDKVQVNNENLEELCKLWIEGNISNFTYISALNRFSGRKLKDPNCHYVFPWVTDFASKCGRNWRDFRKSKFRLNKGDRQLDLTYDNSQNHQVPHHVSDVLSSITYYVYMARRTPKSILCKNIRSIWVPAEYPSSIQRMQEWTPDECIPEFFADPTVFKSIHDDLEDLEVPFWATSPEDFIEKHREALESDHVSERLHHWIDLTFGYKLSGSAAIKSKNVCLNLVDDHTNLIKSGIVQLFTQRHPSRSVTALYWNKLPPNNKQPNNAHSRDKSSTSKSDEDENLISNNSSTNNWGSLGISKYLSRSRSSLHEECAKSASSTTSRSTSLGPKNPTFTSHVASKLKSNQLLVPDNNMSNNNGTIYLPKDFKPESGLEMLEKQFNFLSKTFHTESSKFYKTSTTDDELKSENLGDKCLVQNAFTNFIYAENFDSQFCVKSKPATTKSYSFPLDNKFNTVSKNNEKDKKLESQLNYSEIISKRRIRELQVLGCLIVEIFLVKQLRSLNCNSGNISFPQRLKFCVTVVKSFQHELPLCVSNIVKLLLQPDTQDLPNIIYPLITSFGTPPPSAHLFLEPLIHSLIPFPRSFSTLYKILASLKEFKNVALDLDILYHFDCDGSSCMEYESLEKTKILLARNIAESKVKLCAKQLENFLNSININTEIEIVNILIPHIKELIEDPPTAVLSAWYLFDPIAKVCGTRRSRELLLGPILKLYEQEPSEYCIPYNGKIAKIYHHSFLLRLMVRFGLQCFLENFVTPLVEAVGGYKEFHKFDYLLHTHTEKIAKKTSHLKNMSDNDNDEINKYSSSAAPQMDNNSKEEEVFELGLDDAEKNLIEHLELNITSEDSPFNNVSAAEEALDATLPENVDQLKSLEELNLNLTDDGGVEEGTISTPTIPIPNTKPISNVINIQCEIGSRKSESESPETLKTASKTTKSKENDSKISEMSADSIIWLSHRLGPVLMARYLSRNLLKMLTLCYVGQENLSFIIQNEENTQIKDISVISSRVIGDENAFQVLECLVSITALYGEKLILFQFLPHMTELVVLCKRKLTQTLEGGLISCLVLLKHLIPYLSDVTLMNQLQEILSGIIHPIVRILGSTKCAFPNGFIGRNILARKYVDTLYALSIRIRSAMTRKYLTVPALQRFFYIFDKASVTQKDENSTPKENGASFESLVSIDEEENTQNAALQEIKQVFTAELAFNTYVAFLKHIGENCLDVSLKNHDKIRKLCQIWEQELRNNKKVENKIRADLLIDKPLISSSSSSVGTHINIIGNRIEIQEETESSSSASANDLLLSLVSNRMENNMRHLKGNWFSYWAHEIGRSDKDTNFQFNQIQLQTFVGHTNSVKSIYILDNENSFLSGSRDKTVKLWSLRSQGDGSATSNCQWTYSAHKKSILSLTFIESLRLVASCDGAVHLWDPFMGSIVAQLESPKFIPVNVLKSLPSPSSLIFSATTEGCIKIIDARLASFVYDLKVTINPSGLIRTLAIAPSGNWIAVGQSSGNITVLDTRTGLILSTWRAHEGEILQVVAINEDTLVSSSLDQNISIWNITDGKFKHFMSSSNEPAHCLNIHNGKELISATTGNRIGIHSVISAGASYNNVKLRSDSFKGLLTAIGVLPLNRLLLLGADNGQITLHC